MTEINTQLRTQAVPANRRWRVARLTVTESELALYTWAAMHTGSWAYKGFSTWQEAMDYADRQARTVEAVLPRLSAAAVEIFNRKGLIPYSPEHSEEISLSMLVYALHYRQEVGE